MPWLSLAKQRLDPATGLLPHRADPRTGAPVQGPRGSSQSLLARFLVEADPDWARAQDALFRQHFVTQVYSLPGCLEYPAGTSGRGDVDSGPLIGGVSLPASAVCVAAARLHGDEALAGPILDAGEALGWPIQWRGSRSYFFGQLPVADAFLVWARTATLWTCRPEPAPWSPVVSPWWRCPWHLLTLSPLALAW